MLSLLFIAGRNTLYDIANGAKYRKSQGKKNKTKAKKRREKKRKSPYDYKDDRNRGIPGFIITLHTFGRDLKWNPRIHILCSKKYYDTKSDKMKSLFFRSERSERHGSTSFSRFFPNRHPFQPVPNSES